LRVFEPAILLGAGLRQGKVGEKSWRKSGSCGMACPQWLDLPKLLWNGIRAAPGPDMTGGCPMKQNKLLLLLAVIPVVLNAQSMTVLSTGGDARACSFAAELSERLNPSRSDLDSCNRALDEVHLTRRDRAATFVNRGILQSRLDRYQDALNDYNAALEIEANLPQAWNGKGNLYYLAERYDDAIAAYERALELKLPELQVAHYNLGLTYEKLGDSAAAERSYNTALEIAPDWAPAREKLQNLLGH
jgi:tetratricopeptide (TPR) repeat protein